MIIKMVKVKLPCFLLVVLVILSIVQSSSQATIPLEEDKSSNGHTKVKESVVEDESYKHVINVSDENHNSLKNIHSNVKRSVDNKQTIKDVNNQQEYINEYQSSKLLSKRSLNDQILNSIGGNQNLSNNNNKKDDKLAERSGEQLLDGSVGNQSFSNDNKNDEKLAERYGEQLLDGSVGNQTLSNDNKNDDILAQKSGEQLLDGSGGNQTLSNNNNKKDDKLVERSGDQLLDGSVGDQTLSINENHDDTHLSNDNKNDDKLNERSGEQLVVGSLDDQTLLNDNMINDKLNERSGDQLLDGGVVGQTSSINEDHDTHLSNYNKIDDKLPEISGDQLVDARVADQTLSIDENHVDTHLPNYNKVNDLLPEKFGYKSLNDDNQNLSIENKTENILFGQLGFNSEKQLVDINNIPENNDVLVLPKQNLKILVVSEKNFNDVNNKINGEQNLVTKIINTNSNDAIDNQKPKYQDPNYLHNNLNIGYNAVNSQHLGYNKDSQNFNPFVPNYLNVNGNTRYNKFSPPSNNGVQQFNNYVPNYLNDQNIQYKELLPQSIGYNKNSQLFNHQLPNSLNYNKNIGYNQGKLIIYSYIVPNSLNYNKNIQSNQRKLTYNNIMLNSLNNQNQFRKPNENYVNQYYKNDRVYPNNFNPFNYQQLRLYSANQQPMRQFNNHAFIPFWESLTNRVDRQPQRNLGKEL